jgi:LacI family transcriptional regulator
MATLKDVAKLANVDASTVSRALNNTSYVHPETKKRILAAVKQLSYQPNVLAQGLRQGKRHTLGVIVPRLELTVFAGAIRGAESMAHKRGYELLICTTDDDPDIERECLNRLRNGFVDGILIAGTGKNKHLLRDIQASGIQIVQMVRKADKNISSVVADYESSAYDSTNYLIGQGCQKIGLINGPMEISPYQSRYRGYSQALREHGLREYLATSVPPYSSFQYGYQCAEKLLRDTPDLNAILAAVDIQGIAVLRFLKEHRISVSQQIKLISLTGHSIGRMLQTAMTSWEIPAEEIGKTATWMLVKAIESPVKTEPCAKHITYQATLMKGETA